MFKKIQSFLKGFENKKRNQDYIEYKKIEKKWSKKIDKKIQKNVKIVDFTEGKLTIATKNTAWKNELIFMKEEIKKNFQIKKTQLQQ